MIYWLAIIYFLVVMYLLGFSVSYLLRFKGKDLFENVIMRLAIGLGAFPLLSIVLDWFHLIDWKVVFIISIIVPIISLFKKTDEKSEKISFKIKKTHLYYLVVIILVAATLFVYAKGSFVYPYLEDGDPLSHALATQYIYETGSYSSPADVRITHYLEPYPPFFPAIMSLMLPLAKLDVIWTLKFFNAFIIALGTIFMFFLVKKMTGSNAKAVVSAFLLLAINSYVSHFIFSTSYAVTMIIPSIYFIMYARDGQRESKKPTWFGLKHIHWHSIILAAIIISSVFLIQPTTAGILALFLLVYFLANLKKDEKTKAIFLIVVIGLLLSFVYWVPAIAKYGVEGTSETLGFNMFQNIKGVDTDSSGGVTYSFSNFMNAPKSNKIDQPIGVGIVLFLVFLLSSAVLIWKARSIMKLKNEQASLVLPLLIWTALLIILILGNSLPIPYKFVPHRLWAYFSIGVVLLTVMGGSLLLSVIKSKKAKTAILIIFLAAVYFTSLVPKYDVQTSYWPPGPEWKSQEELQGYLSMAQSLPRNTKIFAFCSQDEKIAGSNMGVIYNHPDLNVLKNNITLITDPGYPLSATLYNSGVKYILVDTACVIKHGVNETNAVLEALRSRSFSPALANGGFFLLQVP